MNPVIKALRASESRRTRFHTSRGQLMPAPAWFALPRAIWRRISGSGIAGPWMVPSAVSHLDRVLQPSWTIFEFGSGWSTPWFAARCQRIVSLEHDPSWHKVVAGALESAQIQNCELRLLLLPDFPLFMATVPDGSLDVVIVDSMELRPGDRIDCVSASKSKVKPGGLIVLDDSDGLPYRRADQVLDGWPATRYVGVKHFPLMAVETTIYERPRG